MRGAYSAPFASERLDYVCGRSRRADFQIEKVSRHKSTDVLAGYVRSLCFQAMRARGFVVSTPGRNSVIALSILTHFLQAHPGPTAILIDKFDAGRFQSAANGQVVGRRH